MSTGYLILGTNLGNKEKNLAEALYHLERYCSIIKPGSIYESEPWGYSDTNTYYNQAIEIQTKLNPEELLSTCLKIENTLGRKRNTGYYEARTMDIDILFYDDLIYCTEILQIPHPKIQFRKFVLLPLEEICPEFVHPLLKKPISKLLSECDDKGWCRKIKNLPKD